MHRKPKKRNEVTMTIHRKSITFIVASPLNWAGMYAYLWAAQGIFMSDLWAKKKPPDSLIIFFMSKWPQKSSEHFTNILWARWGWASLKKRKDEMRENLCRDKIMREDMNGETMRNKNRIFLSERRRMRSEASHTVHERFMSRLWADYERVVILTKREEERIVEWTREKTKRNRERRDKGKKR